MKELIDEAESLYLELSRITESLIYARLHDDNDLLHGCRNELENYAQSVMQTLKCLVDRKDNIIDLGEVWHDGNCVPEEGKQIFVVTKSGFCYAGFYRHFNGLLVNGCLLLGVDIAKYIYVEDLLPKGGE